MGAALELNGAAVVITGGGSGIGAALARRFAALGAQIVVNDLDTDAARRIAYEIDGLAFSGDVADPDEVDRLVDFAWDKLGALDLFCANAGVAPGGDATAPDAAWQLAWQVNVMAHVYASRALLPGMLERGEGYLLNVASAAGVLSQVGDTAYSATKHAAVGLAESLAITYAERGVRVSVVCPQYVATAITGLDETLPEGSVAGVLTVEQAARAIVDGMEREQFLILTHAEVLGFFQRKAADYDRWLAGMRRLRAGLRGRAGFLKVKR